MSAWPTTEKPPARGPKRKKPGPKKKDKRKRSGPKGSRTLRLGNMFTRQELDAVKRSAAAANLKSHEFVRARLLGERTIARGHEPLSMKIGAEIRNPRIDPWEGDLFVLHLPEGARRGVHYLHIEYVGHHPDWKVKARWCGAHQESIVFNRESWPTYIADYDPVWTARCRPSIK